MTKQEPPPVWREPLKRDDIMKILLQILRLPPEAEERYKTAHHIWMALALTGLGCCTGGLSLFFAATAYVKLNSMALLYSYLANPLILVLNLLPPVLLIWLFYFLSRRAWVGFLGSFIPTIGVALVNYFKIRLRSDPLLATDLRLAAEAGGIVGGYTLDLTWLVWFALFCLIAGLLFAVFFIPKGLRGWRERTFGALSCLALMAAAFVSLYLNPEVYARTANIRFINQWSDVEVFVSKGCTYPFLYSFRDMFPTPPPGYDRDEAAARLAEYAGDDIPAEKKVSVMGIMLEAFCDLTDFEVLAGQESVVQVYAPWHELEERSVSGNLLTNIFAGGTVDTEWAFLTGYSAHEDFRSPTDSYVWYFREQGYQTFGSHPGHGWFYNRQNVNQYLGFEDYWFTENHYGQLVDPTAAIWNSDPLLVQELLRQLEDRTAQGPCFSFSVSYQNHGPYADTPTDGTAYLTPAGSGLTEVSCNILNNYLNGISRTVGAVAELTQGLERLEEPVVLVLFGDHKPWAGNGNSVYTELGADFDIATPEGFYDYYATPYLIWANPAAREVLGRELTGTGGDFSPCFLMQELFDQCGWTGPGFMELSREMRAVTPLLHVRGLSWRDGAPAQGLEEDAFYQSFRCMEYYREQEAGVP